MNNFDSAQFLADCWQKAPCVIRQAFSDPYWIEPDELAGLACEDDAEARIISQNSGSWLVESGPFPESRFAGLPETDWTLLVQAVDHWSPEVRDILNHFAFLPRWRLDDIMVSYAPTGGTVSQHYDFFDVFLIQGEGRRKWQIGEVCGSDSELVEGTSVRILKHFKPLAEYVLEPGDVLYIPAKHSHYGVSLSNSLTYSVGFRAPSVRDIVDGIATEALSVLPEDERYTDSAVSLSANAGEIPDAAIEKVKHVLHQALADDSLIRRWLGGHVTERKYPDLELSIDLPDAWRQKLAAGVPLLKNPASRFAYSGQYLFVDGVEHIISRELARYLADSAVDEVLDLAAYAADAKDSDALHHFIKSGCLLFDDE